MEAGIHLGRGSDAKGPKPSRFGTDRSATLLFTRVAGIGAQFPPKDRRRHSRACPVAGHWELWSSTTLRYPTEQVGAWEIASVAKTLDP
jgi:hypothetical protein